MSSQIIYSFKKCSNQNLIAIGPCEQEMLLIWEIEDQDLFQQSVDGGKRELSKTHVVKGIVKNCFGFLHPIQLVEISYLCM